MIIYILNFQDLLYVSMYICCRIYTQCIHRLIINFNSHHCTKRPCGPRDTLSKLDPLPGHS